MSMLVFLNLPYFGENVVCLHTLARTEWSILPPAGKRRLQLEDQVIGKLKRIAMTKRMGTLASSQQTWVLKVYAAQGVHRAPVRLSEPVRGALRALYDQIDQLARYGDHLPHRLAFNSLLYSLTAQGGSTRLVITNARGYQDAVA